MEFTDGELRALYHLTNSSFDRFWTSYNNHNNDNLEEIKSGYDSMKLWDKFVSECLKRNIAKKEWMGISFHKKVKEVTMKEVCEKFGQEVKIIKE